MTRHEYLIRIGMSNVMVHYQVNSIDKHYEAKVIQFLVYVGTDVCWPIKTSQYFGAKNEVTFRLFYLFVPT